MDVRLALTPIWEPVYSLPQGTILEANAAALLAKAAEIPDHYLCYAWMSDPTIHYVGSVTKNWRSARRTSNLRARVAAYLGSTRPTNARVRTQLVETLRTQAVTLGILRFDDLSFGAAPVARATFATEPALVLAVEALLIASYKRDHQCAWNLTGVDSDPEPPL